MGIVLSFHQRRLEGRGPHRRRHRSGDQFDPVPRSGTDDNSPPFQRRERIGGVARVPFRGRLKIGWFLLRQCWNTMPPHVTYLLQSSLPLRVFHQRSPADHSSRSEREIVAIYGWHCAHEQIQGSRGRRNAGPRTSPALIANDDDAFQGNPIDQGWIVKVDQ